MEIDIVSIIGEEHFRWIAREFDRETTLGDVPLEILKRISTVRISSGNAMNDSSHVTSIAVLTFAYKLAGKAQIASSGTQDILLLKVLAVRELDRRANRDVHTHNMWNAPLMELITGEVGDRIRAMPSMAGPSGTEGA